MSELQQQEFEAKFVQAVSDNLSRAKGENPFKGEYLFAVELRPATIQRLMGTAAITIPDRLKRGLLCRLDEHELEALLATPLFSKLAERISPDKICSAGVEDIYLPIETDDGIVYSSHPLRKLVLIVSVSFQLFNQLGHDLAESFQAQLAKAIERDPQANNHTLRLTRDAEALLGLLVLADIKPAIAGIELEELGSGDVLSYNDITGADAFQRLKTMSPLKEAVQRLSEQGFRITDISIKQNFCRIETEEGVVLNRFPEGELAAKVERWPGI